FAAWVSGDGTAFFKVLAEDVRWTVIGASPVSRTYTSRQQFLDGAVKPLSEKLAGPIQPTVLNVIAEGDNVVVQWQGQAPTKAGPTYRNSYCWVMRLENGRVKEGTAYIDTEAVTELWRSGGQQ
ncbi:MAG: nuclear transport factor 2 family protein, partial [Candidatus Binatia bacterium]